MRCGHEGSYHCDHTIEPKIDCWRNREGETLRCSGVGVGCHSCEYPKNNRNDGNASTEQVPLTLHHFKKSVPAAVEELGPIETTKRKHQASAGNAACYFENSAATAADLGPMKQEYMETPIQQDNRTRRSGNDNTRTAEAGLGIKVSMLVVLRAQDQLIRQREERQITGQREDPEHNGGVQIIPQPTKNHRLKE
ncbi:hypothetical protein DFS33DRAFT_1269118 [Desarmillaria ectypa]|nr:hypothetical protein DFS33DRAFT_1269118 [Desarmillaria ectypa]